MNNLPLMTWGLLVLMVTSFWWIYCMRCSNLSSDFKIIISIILGIFCCGVVLGVFKILCDYGI